MQICKLTHSHGDDVDDGEGESDEEPDELVVVQTALALSDVEEVVDQVGVQNARHQREHESCNAKHIFPRVQIKHFFPGLGSLLNLLDLARNLTKTSYHD